MQIYKTPVKDIRFALESLGYDQVSALPKHADFDLETIVGMIEEAGKFCADRMLPLNHSGDLEGLKYDPETHTVTTPKGFKQLYRDFCENGYAAMAHPSEFGGSDAPYVFAFLMSEISTATNKSFSMCPGLTQGLVDALLHHGTESQKEQYIEKLITGVYTGTMCLTEPQCGTDLGILTTKAEPIEGEEGAFALTGTKIWITFGEHDLTDNIVHLVLARLPGAPEGTAGISTFLVPKFLENGERNPVFCGGLEHKMGIHASPTCVMNFEGAKGWLIGQPNKGMKVMFTMMNAARLSVGIEGISLSEISYQTALAFAKDRRQSRSLDVNKQDKSAKADNILVHPDVRRMLLNVKASTEGMRALAIWVAIQLDISEKHEDPTIKQEAADLVALLTPVIKSYCTERGFWNVSEAMQAMGGAGYTQDWSVEQYLRDMRIAMLYEGTNHIQALDLVGRKLPMGGGRAIMAFQNRVTALIKESKGNEFMEPFINQLKDASKLLTDLTMNTLMAKGAQDPEEAGAVASNYLNVFALTAIWFVWCLELKSTQGKSGSFYETKIKTGRYFMNHILPQIHSLAAVIRQGKADMMAFDASEF
jgi:alkylation response protein AidB-like acyl-CoA dehydrogenase